MAQIGLSWSKAVRTSSYSNLDFFLLSSETLQPFQRRIPPSEEPLSRTDAFGVPVGKNFRAVTVSAVPLIVDVTP